MDDEQQSDRREKPNKKKNAIVDEPIERKLKENENHCNIIKLPLDVSRHTYMYVFVCSIVSSSTTLSLDEMKMS
jgi:hypothetical protein